jgi:pimeloyl-ACP methyl ester carboxylesterase
MSGTSRGPAAPPAAPAVPAPQGFIWLPEDDFVKHFASGVDPVRARVLHAAQQPLAGSSFTDVMGTPSWKSRPSWYMVATGDQAIPPGAERLFASRMGATTVEVDAGHLAIVSHPGETAQLITAAAEALG